MFLMSGYCIKSDAEVIFSACFICPINTSSQFIWWLYVKKKNSNLVWVIETHEYRLFGLDSHTSILALFFFLALQGYQPIKRSVVHMRYALVKNNPIVLCVLMVKLITYYLISNI